MLASVSHRLALVAAVAAVSLAGPAQAVQYFYGGFDGTNTGTPSAPVSGPWQTSGGNTWYTDTTVPTPLGVNTAPPASNLSELYLGGDAAAAAYTLTLPNANQTANVIVLTAINTGTNTVDFLQTSGNRLALATPNPAQTFGASIQLQGSANWQFTNTTGANAALRFSNSFTIGGNGTGTLSIPMILSNTSSAVNATVALTNGGTVQLGATNLFGGTTGQFFNFNSSNGKLDFTNGRAFGNAGNQIRLTNGTLLSSTGSTVATYSGTTAATAGGILLAGNVTFAGSVAWSLGASTATLTNNRTLTVTNSSTGGVTMPNAIGESAAGFGLTVGVNSTGKLTLTGTNTYTGTTTVAGGTLVLGANAQAPVLTGAGGANIQGSGKLLLDYTGGSSPVAAVKTAIDLSAASNFTTGQFKATTLAAGQTLGYGDNGTDTVTVRVTLPGDADLNGNVDFNDFLALQNNFGNSGTRFDQGNFNYDGQTDFNDFLALQNFFGQSVNGTPIDYSDAQVAALTAFAANPANQAVPEPASLALIGLGATALLRRRR